MDLTNISEATEWFEVLQTSKRSQSAMMTLASGASTGQKAEAHKKSDQILLVLRGKLTGEVGQEKVCLKKGDVLLIPARTPHWFTNKTARPAVIFNVYAPPEYPVGTKG